MKDTNYEILVVSDGSTDKTLDIAKGCGAIIYDKQHSGLANTFRQEMKLAVMMNPNIIIHTDADGQYSASEIPNLINKLKEGYDLVLGNRLHKRPVGMTLKKYLINKFGALEFSLLLRHKLPDIATGFRAFTTRIAEIPITSHYTYTHEQIFKAKRAGAKVTSINIEFLKREYGESRLIGTNIFNYILAEAKDWSRFLK